MAPAADGPSPSAWSIAVQAQVDPDARAVHGMTTITVRNPTNRPLSAVRVYRYADHYATRPELDDILWERVYPGLWRPASMELGSVTVRQPDGTTATVTAEPVAGTVVSVIPLPSPLLPGGSVELTIPFTTSIPIKYGTFGAYRGVMTASGGWHPLPVQIQADGSWLDHVLPPRADWDVTLEVPRDVGLVLGRGALPPASRSTGAQGGGDGWTTNRSHRAIVPDAFVPTPGPALEVVASTDTTRTVRYVTSGRSFVGLTTRRAFHQRNVPLTDGSSLTWVGRPLGRAQTRWVRRAAESVRVTLAELGLPASTDGLVLVEAPMRRNLVELGDGVIYVSDRFLEAEIVFWRYYDVHLARAMIALSLERSVVAREQPDQADLTLDGVSWALIGDYLAVRWRNHTNLRRLLQRFSFFPQVESLLETPAFPFADQIFDNPWIVDPLRADMRRFNRPLRSGRALFLRLGDRAGPDTLRQATLRYLGSPTPGADFLTTLHAASGLEVHAFAAAWRAPVPRVDFRLIDVARARTEEGFHRTTVTVERVALEGAPPDEVVEIRLRPAIGKRGHVWLRWTGRDQVATWDVITQRRVDVVEVDPRGRLLEMDEHGLSLKQDNRRPVPIRVSGFGYAGLSITGQGFEAYGLLNIRPRFNARDQVNVRAFTNEQSIGGGGLTYAHYFGPPRWGLALRHRLVFTGDFVWLSQRFRETDAPFLADFSAGYVFESRSNSYMPSKGGRFSVTVSWGRDFALKNDAARPLRDSGFIGVDVQAIRLLKLHPFHILALKGKAGLVVGNVEHSQFPVGGNRDLRGIPESQVLTPGRVTGTVEWRHFFFKDADLPTVAHRIRALQGSLFIEGALAARQLDVAPTGADLHLSIGYGFRWFIDWFGVIPAAWGMDFAWSPGAPKGLLPIGLPDEWPEVPFQVYFVGSQSF